MKKSYQHIIIILMLSFFIGCPVEHDISYVIEIESNTSWAVVYHGKTVEGFGNRFIDLPSKGDGYDLPVCALIKKKSIRGYVKARIAADEGVSILGSYDGEWFETYASFGEMRVCSKK